MWLVILMIRLIFCIKYYKLIDNFQGFEASENILITPLKLTIAASEALYHDNC